MSTQFRQFITNLRAGSTGKPGPPAQYDYYNTPPTCPAGVCRDYNNQSAAGVAANRYIAIGYPYDRAIADGCSAATGGQYCNIVTYKLSSGTNPLARTSTNLTGKCAAGSKNLIRSVGNGTGTRVLECVADFEVLFDYDKNNDNDVLDTDEKAQTTLPGSTANIIKDVRNIDMYVLVQAGPRREKYTFSGDITLGGEITFDTDKTTTVNNGLTAEQKKYPWKVVKISAKPLSWYSKQ